MNRYLSPMFILIALVLVCLLYATVVKAATEALVFSNEQGTVRLTEESCQLENISLDIRKQLKAGSAVYEGKSFRLCWIASGPWVLMHYEDDDQGRLLFERFTRETGA